MGWYDPQDAVTVADEGWYPAVIESVTMGQTKKGAPMETVAFRVYTPKREMVIKDYFHPQNLWKYKKLAAALGQAEQFAGGVFAAGDFKGKGFEAELIIEDSAQYGEQNKIRGFSFTGVNTAGVSGVSAHNKSTDIGKDDIPF